MTRTTKRRWLVPAAALLWLDLVLIQPNHPDAMHWDALTLFPLELPVIVLALLALGTGLGGQALRAFLVAALTLIAVLKVADFAMFLALGRGFNPVADLPLVDAGVRLISGTLGAVAGIGAVIGAVLIVAGIGWALWAAMGVWMRRAPARRGWRLAAAGAAGLAAAVAVSEIGQAMRWWSLPVLPPGAAFTARVGVERVQMARRTLADLRTFSAAAQADPIAGREGLFDRIDRDVLVVFVESYGRASLDNAFYAETHRATLAQAEINLTEAGLAMRSGVLAAPTRGGQSWLSHTTFSDGLWVDNQARYLAALASGRQGLFHLARAAGFQTATVAPAITMDWPEAASMGFDRILAAKDLGYAGQPFNWVTMPDQYTLSALDKMLRGPGRAQHLFAEVVLISSHAPWVPVPKMVPWEALGDGHIFDAAATAGEAPEVVWRDTDRVRDQYRLSIDYALTAAFGYLARQADDAPLVFLLGDHQAAGFVAMDERPDVPIHVIGPPDLVAETDGWGWAPGLFPGPEAKAIPMDRMRDMIIRAFSSGLDDGRPPT